MLSFKNTPPSSAVSSKLTFPCSDCNFEAQSARQLSRHKAVTHTQNALKCVLCPFVTAYQTNLLRHRKDVHGICGSKGNKSCKFCGFVSEDNDTLIQHQIEYHQDILKSAQVKFAKELVSAGGDDNFAEYESINNGDFLKNRANEVGSNKKAPKQKAKLVPQLTENNFSNMISAAIANRGNGNSIGDFENFWKNGLVDVDQFGEQEDDGEDDEYYNTNPLMISSLDVPSESMPTSRSSTPKSQSSHNFSGKDLPATRIRRHYTCTDCSFRSTNPREFLYHRKDGHGYKIKIVECPYCVYACQYVQKLQRHLYLVHKMNVSPNGVDGETGILKKKYKKSRNNFEENDSISDGEKMQQMNSVMVNEDEEYDDDDDEGEDQSMGADANLDNVEFEVNMNEYSNGKFDKQSSNDSEDDKNMPLNVECSLCKIKFGDILSAQKHFMKIHKNVDPKNYLSFIKEEESDILNPMLNNQKKVIDTDKTVHVCNYCGYKTRWISELERHVRVHSKEKPFKCMFCDFSSKWKGDLNRHIQRYHSNETSMIDADDSDGSGNGENPLYARDTSPPTPISQNDEEAMGNDDVYVPEMSLNNEQYSETVEEDDVPLENGCGNKEDTQLANSAKMYKCSYCEFTCLTASRFHVHYVQHLNTKPFQCSICGHRSNWEWDVTKHIKMKAQRDPAHAKAQPVLIHDSGKRDYSKYDRFVVWVGQTEADGANKEANKIDFRGKKIKNDNEECDGDNDLSAVNNILEPVVCFEVDNSSTYKSDSTHKLAPKSVVIFRHKDSEGRKISCLECDFKHHFARVMVAHMTSHFNEKPYACKHCVFETNWREVITSHIENHHKQFNNMDFIMRFRCTIDENGICKIVDEHELNDLENSVSSCYQETPLFGSVNNGEVNSSLIEPNIYEEKAVIRCEMCPFLTTNLKKMTIHCRFHNPSKGSLQCKHCPYYVNSKDKLMRHQKLHQNTDNCVQPNQVYSSPHHTESELLTCQLCSYQTKNAIYLNDHMKIHDDTQIDQLDNEYMPESNGDNESNPVEYESQLNENGSSLLQTATNGPNIKFSYTCKECPAAFKSPGDYKIHLVFHSSNYEYPCSYCSYRARNKAQLCKHLYVHTNEYISKRANSYPEGSKHLIGNQDPNSLMASLGFGHKRKYNTKGQKNPKTGRKQRTKNEFPMKPVKVKLNSEENGKQQIVFNNKDLMGNQEFLETKEYLQRINSGIKNRCMYRCSKCPAVFTKVNTLIYHMTLHDQKAAFTCEICNYSTATEDNLSIHSLLHNLTESQTAVGYNFNYTCHKCPAGFSKRTRLEKHLSLHGAHYNWKCDKCDYSVRYAATLVKHRALHLINPNFEVMEGENLCLLQTADQDKPLDQAPTQSALKLKLNFSKLQDEEDDDDVEMEPLDDAIDEDQANSDELIVNDDECMDDNASFDGIIPESMVMVTQE